MKKKVDNQFLPLVLMSCALVFHCQENARGAETSPKQEMLFWDHTQPLEKRVHDLVSRLTLTEKIHHLGPNSAAIERLEIEPYVHWNHATHGVAACLLYPDTDSTVYPSPINQAATWNPGLIQQMAAAISEEARAKFHREEKLIGGVTFWSPTVNMARDPRWGRTCEAYGEDPHLASAMAVAFSRGLQGDDPKYLKTIATPKHFVANNDERIRERGNADVPERSLREYFMRPYRAAIQEAKAYSIMMAYNKLNGVPCVANDWLIGDVLRGEWGFEGFVVSDAGCIGNMYAKMHYVDTPEDAAALGLHAGCDVSIAGGYGQLGKALERGLVTEQDIDVSVRRMFKSRFLLGEFDPPEMVSYTQISQDVIACEEHREISRQIARESIVLLKNENKLLPLSRKVETVAVLGPNHKTFEWGTYNGKSVDPETALQGIQDKLGPRAKIVTANGCTIPGSPRPNHHGAEAAEPVSADYITAADGSKGWKAEYFNNAQLDGPAALQRTDAAIAFDWGAESPAPGVNKDNFSVRWTGTLRPSVSRSYKLMIRADDGVRVTLDGKTLFDHLQGGLESSTGLHLDEGSAYEVCVEYVEVGGDAKANFSWDFIAPEKAEAKRKKLETAETAEIEAAVALAEAAEIAIVIVGTSAYVESEGYDRVEIGLPGRQQELIRRVCAVNPRTVVVLINGSSLALPWVKENAPAVVEAFFSGPDVGTALADVLFGDYNPSGRLPMTFYQSMDQLPPMEDYDVISGERTYLYFPGPVCFPFGYGLSYTKFQYSDLQLSARQIARSGELTVGLDVENVGGRAGSEVVQLYVNDVQASVKRPLKELMAFDKITLNPGEKKRVRFNVRAKDLAFWDVGAKQWTVEPGTFQLMAGASSADIRLKQKFSVK